MGIAAILNGHTNELLGLNKNISISNDNIEYILEDASLRSEVENEIHILDDKIKERF